MTEKLVVKVEPLGLVVGFDSLATSGGVYNLVFGMTASGKTVYEPLLKTLRYSCYCDHVHICNPFGPLRIIFTISGRPKKTHSALTPPPAKNAKAAGM